VCCEQNKICTVSLCKIVLERYEVKNEKTQIKKLCKSVTWVKVKMRRCKLIVV